MGCKSGCNRAVGAELISRREAERPRGREPQQAEAATATATTTATATSRRRPVDGENPSSPHGPLHQSEAGRGSVGYGKAEGTRRRRGRGRALPSGGSRCPTCGRGAGRRRAALPGGWVRRDACQHDHLSTFDIPLRSCLPSRLRMVGLHICPSPHQPYRSTRARSTRPVPAVRRGTSQNCGSDVERAAKMDYDAMVNAAAVYLQEGMGLPKHVWNHEAPAGGLVLAVCADVIPIRRGTRCSTSPRQPPSSASPRCASAFCSAQDSSRALKREVGGRSVPILRANG